MMDSTKDYAFDSSNIDAMGFREQNIYIKKKSTKLNHVKQQYRHLG
jgi:hypothetical protein